MRNVILFFSLFLCLLGCGPKKDTASWFADTGKTKVLCTTGMIQDLVERIGQDKVDAHALIVGEIDPHSYELVKGDDEKMAFAQLIIGNGLNLEHGASVRNHLAKHSHVVYIGDEIQKKVPEKILRVSREIDPHVWMDISLWAEGVDAIVQALSKEDPGSATFYKNNGALLYAQMLSEHLRLQEVMREVPDSKRFLVTSHDAFHYFARAYLSQGEGWEARCVAPEGLAPEGQLSTQDIKRVAKHLCENEIGVVFPESNMNQDALKKVISCCSHKVRFSDKPLYGDAMGTGNYLDMIRHNVETLKSEWSQ
ncbi:MAG: zinc ABC transporter substrate-binding protein [Simkaniaceae bacterium]|nr:zinc ABC transporter substrate-binding protein [Candidatus Sacchlamyda saccharinae]